MNICQIASRHTSFVVVLIATSTVFGDGADSAIISDEKQSLTPEQAAAADKFSEAVAALQDPAFERFVSIDDVGVACQTLDVEGLIDGALQIAEGESVLLRPHQSGVTASELLNIAASAAITLGESSHFDRLLKAARKVGASDVVARVEASGKLADESRSVMDSFGDLEWLLMHIHCAKFLGDKSELDAAANMIPDDADDAEREKIRGFVSTAKADVDNAKESETMSKLLAPSRQALAITSMSVRPGAPRDNQTIRVRATISGIPFPFWSYRLTLTSTRRNVVPMGWLTTSFRNNIDERGFWIAQVTGNRRVGIILRVRSTTPWGASSTLTRVRFVTVRP